uniref:Uncharacterized protein n=1 Tax=Talaromyces marneffei PM1 TaxID=1077442 RepID=A0A093V2L9_TALMA
MANLLLSQREDEHEYFDRVRAAIQEYGILSEDIYNFDETGFVIGLCATAKVITGSDRYSRPYLLQPGNREWVTAIKAVNSTGWALPSRSSNSQSSCLQTPQNPRQFKRQITTIKKRINDHPTSPLERVDQAINRMSKAYEMSINELLIVRKEVHDLRAANEKEKKKRKRSRAHISYEGSLTAQEAQELIASRNKASESIPAAPVESEPQASQPRTFTTIF